MVNLNKYSFMSDLIENLPLASLIVPLIKHESEGCNKLTLTFIIGFPSSSRILPVRTCEYATFAKKAIINNTFFFISINPYIILFQFHLIFVRGLHL